MPSLRRQALALPHEPLPCAPVALVTGAGRPVGAAIARRLAASGYRLLLQYHHSREATEQLAAELPGAHALCADLRSATGPAALVEAGWERTGRLDLLVHGAGTFPRTAAASLAEDGWEEALDLHVRAAARLAQAARPSLEQARGAIVFLTCVSATIPFPGYLAYSVAKGAEAHLMRALALEFAPLVRVNAIAPGVVHPPEGTSAELRDHWARTVPLQCLGTPADVAEAVAFLAGATFITGHELPVDGGRHLQRRG